MFNPFKDMPKYQGVKRPAVEPIISQPRHPHVFDWDTMITPKAIEPESTTAMEDTSELEQALVRAVKGCGYKSDIHQLKMKPEYEFKPRGMNTQTHVVEHHLSQELRDSFLYKGVYQHHLESIQFHFAKRKVPLKSTPPLHLEFKDWLRRLKNELIAESTCLDILRKDYMQDKEGVDHVVKAIDIPVTLFMNYSTRQVGEVTMIALPSPRIMSNIEEYIHLLVKEDGAKLSFIILLDVLLNEPCFKI